MANKNNKKRASKKINKEMDVLLKEKKKLEDTMTLKAITPKSSTSTKKKTSTTTKKKTTTSSKKTTPKKKEAVVAPTRKTTTPKKKEAIVAPERKTSTKKKTTTTKKRTKKSVTISQKEKEKLKKSNPKKKVVSEDTLRLNKFEDEMRNLYDNIENATKPVEEEPLVDPIISATNVVYEEEKPDQEEVVPTFPERIEDYEEEVSHEVVIDDFTHKEEEEIPTKKRISGMYLTTLILAIIFIILFIAFIAFIIYVCTY